MMWICSGTPAGQLPNSSGGMQEWKSTTARAPGLLCATACAGSAPSEKPTYTSSPGRSAAAAWPRSMTVSKPTSSA